MIEQDTIKLLRECDAGVKMGVDSIDDVLDDVKSEELKRCLNERKRRKSKTKAIQKIRATFNCYYSPYFWLFNFSRRFYNNRFHNRV